MLLGLLGLLLPLAFIEGIPELATAPRWAFLAVALPLCLIFTYREAAPHWARWAGVGLIGLVGVSALWSPDVLTAQDEVVHLIILAAAFFLGAVSRSLKPFWKGLMVGVAVSAILALLQKFGFINIGGVHVAGLFSNKNVLAEAGMVALVAIIFERNYVMVPFALLAVVIGNSLAVYVALAVVLLCWASRNHPGKAALAFICMLCAGFIHAFTSLSESVTVRLEMWQTALINLKFFGNGLGAYTANYPRWEYAHSEVFHYLYECGVLAVPAIAVYAALAFGDKSETESAILVAIGVCALFAFPFHMPVTAASAALASGIIARRWSVVCREHDQRTAASETHRHRADNSGVDGAVGGRCAILSALPHRANVAGRNRSAVVSAA